MKVQLLLLFFLPGLIQAQKISDLKKVVPSVISKVLPGVHQPNLEQVINPTPGPNDYRTLPWLHQFLDTASVSSVYKFLKETNDSVLQLVHYETMSVLHAINYSPPGTDKDRDGHTSAESGGDDCDDLDGNCHPGNPETCSGYRLFDAWKKKYIIIYKYHDEDCNPCTVTGYPPDGDMDGDKIICSSCLNYSARSPIGCPYDLAIVPTVSAISLSNPLRAFTIRGGDCDDHNPALGRASQICIDKRTVAVCENGEWKYYPCTKCVVQPNGTGVVAEF